MGLQTQPFTTPTYPVPLLFLLSLTSVLSLSDLRRAVTKVKYTLFLFSPFSEQRSIRSLTSSLSVTKVKYTFFLL